MQLEFTFVSVAYAINDTTETVAATNNQLVCPSYYFYVQLV